MGYFRELPNLEYLSLLPDRVSSSEYVEVKNLFKRVRLREDFYSTITNFEKYQILDGERPDHVAKKLYDSSDLDWVVLISADIINVRDQWPLSDGDIYDFAENIYGTAMNDTRFYETIEVKDSKGRIILPAGQVVDYNFKSPKPKVDSSPTSSYIQYWDDGLNQSVTKSQITIPISNYQYETRLNNAKRSIYVLRRSYLVQFITDMRKMMKYKGSTQFVTELTKKSDNIRIKSP